MIGDNDWSVLFGPAFSVPVSFVGGEDGALSAEARGIFTAAGATVAGGDFGGGVSTALPIATLPAAWVPDWLAPDRDRVTVAGVDYVLRDMRPDGSGLSRLILERDF